MSAHSLGVILGEAGARLRGDGEVVEISRTNRRLNDRYVPESVAVELRRECERTNADALNWRSEAQRLRAALRALVETAEWGTDVHAAGLLGVINDARALLKEEPR